jgi:hypothetical protein
MSEYNSLLTHLDRILEGKEQYIPNPHDRIRETFNLHKGRYILVGSNSGVGKTSVVDDTLILKPYEWVSKQSFDFHYEVLYYSMERATRDKLAKWLSWKIYQDKGLKIPSNVFSVGSQGDIKLDANHTKLAKEYEPWMKDLLSHITIHQGPQYPSKIREDIEKAARRLLYTITSDNTNIYINGVEKAKFEPSIVKQTISGMLPYRILNIADEKIEIFPNQVKYVLRKSNTFFYILLDHIGKLRGDSKKNSIDEVDEILSTARDNYQMSPIAISQFNRAIGDITRIKFANGSLEPTLDDFKDSGNPTESADLILSIFDPYRYHSFSKEGLYHGYNIADSMNPSTLSPSGNQRFRSLHVLKNSYGPSQITYGMRFTGEVMDFKLLPLPNDPALIKVYEEIALNK